MPQPDKTFPPSLVATPDGGPLYAETDLTRWVAEPWNAYSSLAFLLPVLYWAWRLRGRYRQYPFLVGIMPLLFFGGLGSTLYHAFRRSRFFWALDVFPIALLTLLVSLYFWWLVFSYPDYRRWLFVGLVALLSVGLRYWLFASTEVRGPLQINLSYFVTGVFIFLPALILLRRTHFLALRSIVLSTLLFAVALLFRRLDAPYEWMPMGTHWLWHVLGAAGAFYLGDYLYRLAYLFNEERQSQAWSR